MRSRWIASSLVVIVFVAGAATKNSLGQLKDPALNAIGSDSSYPESPDGLKKLIEDGFEVVKSKDQAKISSYMAGFVIPDHNAWFARTFGATEGARLEAKYNELLPEIPEGVRKSFEYALKGNRTDVGVKVFEKTGNAIGLGRAALDAMLEPVAIYLVDGSSPQEKFPAFIGDFVYANGGFRYVDTQVWQALSSAPPLRIRLGGNTAKANLVQKVNPIYPDEAKATHTEGEVLLHVVLAADGTVKELNVVKGDPVLAKAAAEAVRQWRYKPTLLNGKPVEVDTTISIVFSVNR